MPTKHSDARLLALGFEYDRSASECDKLVESPPSDFEELVREEERLHEEGLRLLRELKNHTAQTLEGVAAQFIMIGHCNRWAGTTSAKRAQEEEAVADVLAWQIVAALPAIIEQLGISAGGKLEAGAEAV